MRRHLLRVLLLAAIWRASLITAADYETILIPVALKQVAGANGSLWSSSLLLYNGGAQTIDPNYPSSDIYPLDSSCGVQPPCPPIDQIAPGVTASPVLFWRQDGYTGLLLHVRQELAPTVRFYSRVQDLSRESLTWGTEIPVIREGAFLTGRSEFLGVPLDSRFRQTLRIYDPDSHNLGVFAIRMFSLDDTQPILETTLDLTRPPASNCTAAQELCFPSMIVLSDLLSAFPQLNGLDEVRVEVEPLTMGLRYWAMVSITNNETQHVTTISP